MIVRNVAVHQAEDGHAVARALLAWVRSPSAVLRADRAGRLALAYVRGELAAISRDAARQVMTALLDDASPLVRLSLAEALGGEPGAPREIITVLAGDRSDIAALVLIGSPLLSDADLVEAVAIGDSVAQEAVASRAGVTPGVSSVLAEIGSLMSCMTLCVNHSAIVRTDALSRMIQRFGQHAEFRETLLHRPDLDPVLRHELVAATADVLARFVIDCDWMSATRAKRITRDATDHASITISADCLHRDGEAGSVRLVASLRAAGRLTPALILRALLCGNAAFFNAAMSDLSGLPLARVAGMAFGGQGIKFTALYAKAGLPPTLLAAFQAAVLLDDVEPDTGGTVLHRRRIAKVQAACAREAGGGLDTVMTLLRRFAAEAARRDARKFAEGVARNPHDVVDDTTAPVVSREPLLLTAA